MTSLYLSELLKRSSAQTFHVTLVDPAAEALGQRRAFIAGMIARVKASCLNTTAESFVQTREGTYDVIIAYGSFIMSSLR